MENISVQRRMLQRQAACGALPASMCGGGGDLASSTAPVATLAVMPAAAPQDGEDAFSATDAAETQQA